MNTEYIRSLLNVFHNHSIYDIETALIIYEFSDEDSRYIKDEELNRVYELIKSQDEIIDEYIIEKYRQEEREKEEELNEREI